MPKTENATGSETAEPQALVAITWYEPELAGCALGITSVLLAAGAPRLTLSRFHS